MPWPEVSTMKLEFALLASQEGANIAELCRRFGISRQTGYEVLRAFREHGPEGLQPRSRRPHRSPDRTDPVIERTVLDVRRRHPVWGGRKIRAWLLNQGYLDVPATSTVTDILRRHGLINPDDAAKHRPFQRFEHEAPNQLWQMDFKGHFATTNGRCHPLTVLDDHSRYSLCLKACADERRESVQQALTEAFRRYGLPERMTMDNGVPWGSREEPMQLVAWLIRLGISVGHSRPFHPQTQGKDERFHRTLKAEVISNRTFRDLAHCQHHFDVWREIYNQQRPHEALDNNAPIQRYRPSKRVFPETLPAVDYGPDDLVRKVDDKGDISLRGRQHRIGKGFYGQLVAIRPTAEDGLMAVYFCHQKLTNIDLRVTR